MAITRRTATTSPSLVPGSERRAELIGNPSGWENLDAPVWVMEGDEDLYDKIEAFFGFIFTQIAWTNEGGPEEAWRCRNKVFLRQIRISLVSNLHLFVICLFSMKVPRRSGATEDGYESLWDPKELLLKIRWHDIHGEIIIYNIYTDGAVPMDLLILLPIAAIGSASSRYTWHVQHTNIFDLSNEQYS